MEIPDKREGAVFLELCDRRLLEMASSSVDLADEGNTVARLALVMKAAQTGDGRAIAREIDRLGIAHRDELLASFFYLDEDVFLLPRDRLSHWLDQMGDYRPVGIRSLLAICDKPAYREERGEERNQRAADFEMWLRQLLSEESRGRDSQLPEGVEGEQD